METGTRSLRKAFKKGSWRDWPLAIGFSLFLQLRVVRRHKRIAAQLPCKATHASKSPSTMVRNRHGDLNMRLPSKPKLGQLAADVSIPRQFIDVGVEPLPLLCAHPGQLPLGKLARSRNGSSHRLLQPVLAVEVRPQLPVADRAHRGVTGR